MKLQENRHALQGQECIFLSEISAANKCLAFSGSAPAPCTAHTPKGSARKYTTPRWKHVEGCTAAQ